MRLWKRLKNLWEISKFSQEDYVSYVEGVVIPSRKPEEIFTGFDKLPDPSQFVSKEKLEFRPFATIIKLKPKDEVEQILKENADQS